MATSSGLFLATIYNQSQLVERKHVARYWAINTAATAVPLSAHPSPLVIITKLAAAIFGGVLFGGGVVPAQYCPCGPYGMGDQRPVKNKERTTARYKSGGLKKSFSGSAIHWCWYITNRKADLSATASSRLFDIESN